MIRTLYWYLSRELVKVTGLALVAFTLVMTVFAIIEPLRKEGLGTEQLFSLIGYTLPVMVSLTLPIAALFAATIVYGRFSQDRELMACRASGISTPTLLKPAIVLGAVVTVVSLALSNYVAPRMAENAELAVKANIRGIVFRQLRTKSYVKRGFYIIHADSVDEQKNMLCGVVAAETKNPNNIKTMTAQTAFVDFHNVYGETYVTMYLVNPVGTQSGRPDAAQAYSQPLQYGPLPNFAKESPAWYDWSKLVQTLREPEKNEQILADLNRIRLQIGYDMLSRQVERMINAGKPYDRLRNETERYVITAPKARIDNEEDGKSIVVLSGDENQRVHVDVIRGDRIVQSFTADHGEVEAKWSLYNDIYQHNSNRSTVVSLMLTGNVVRDGDEAAHAYRREDWAVGELAMPADIAKRASGITLEDVYLRSGELTEDKAIRSKVRELKNYKIRRLINEIIAEMHSRIAYGISCFLLVALGAALGIIFKGGQLISAFAISVIPAAIVIVLMLMGKEMVSHPDIKTWLGLVAIWSGIVALAAGTGYVYLRLLRR